jgi:hypothetical protein
LLLFVEAASLLQDAGQAVVGAGARVQGPAAPLSRRQASMGSIPLEGDLGIGLASLSAQLLGPSKQLLPGVQVAIVKVKRKMAQLLQSIFQVVEGIVEAEAPPPKLLGLGRRRKIC